VIKAKITQTKSRSKVFATVEETLNRFFWRRGDKKKGGKEGEKRPSSSLFFPGPGLSSSPSLYGIVLHIR